MFFSPIIAYITTGEALRAIRQHETFQVLETSIRISDQALQEQKH